MSERKRRQNDDNRSRRGKFQKRGGRGRGRGRGNAHKNQDEFSNVIVTKPETIKSKTAQVGEMGAENDREITLVTNYFKVQQTNRIIMIMYRVDFEPPIESWKFRTTLINSIGSNLGLHVYDNANSIYLMNKLPDRKMVFETKAKDGQPFKIQLREAREIPYTDGMFFTILNLIIRRCMEAIQLNRDGRMYIDYRSKVAKFIESLRIQVLPGKFFFHSKCNLNCT